MAHYSQQAQALVLRLPEHLGEGVRQRLRDGGMDGVQLTARADGVEGLPDFASKHGVLDLSIDEEVYPARIVNLPCVVEVHKTVDNATLFKSGDVGQMVVVYASEAELWEDIKKEQEERERVKGQGGQDNGEGLRAAAQALQKQLDYYPSGLTPPTRHIVRRRFAETRMHGPYPAEIVSKVQTQLQAHVAAAEEKRGDGLAVVEEVLEDIVDFEDYMVDHHSGQPVTITEDSPLWLEHPELMIHRPVQLPPDDPSVLLQAPSSRAPSPAISLEPSFTTGGAGASPPGSYAGEPFILAAPTGAAAAAAASVLLAPDITTTDSLLEAKDISYGASQLPLAPPPAHRKKKEQEKQRGRIVGGQRVAAPSASAAAAPLDLPPQDEQQMGSFFAVDDTDDGDDFLNFLEKNAGEEGGLDFGEGDLT